MNRRQKIIVSVVGIFIVLLALVGVTYGYFLTRIQGNTNTTSITVTTADLKLVYGDGNGVLTPAELLMPGKDIKFLDANGKTVESKTFTVTNEGNDTDYVVIFEDVSVTYASNGTTINGNSYNAGDTTTFESNDFRYTLTCVERDKDGNETECNGIKYDSFPMNGGVVVGNEINSDVVHTYTLTMKYLETGKDQSLDMNKTISAKINIEDIRRINPYKENTNSLAYNIINNSIIGENGTKLVATPPSKVAEEISDTWEEGIEQTVTIPMAWISYYSDSKEEIISCIQVGECNNIIEKTDSTTCENLKNKFVLDLNTSDIYLVIDCKEGIPVIKKGKNESVLASTTDEYGTSYYYRGSIEDNYVDFAGMCWRIVRISGDDSIKLILEDQDNTCASSNGNWDIETGHFGYDDRTYFGSMILNYLNPNQVSTKTAMVNAFQKFQNNVLSDYLDKLKSGNWCLDDIAYDVYNDTISTFDLITAKPIINNEILDKYINENYFYYDSLVRLSGKNNNYYPTIKCNGIKMDKYSDNTEMFVGGITADETIFAGGKYETPNTNYYLINEYQKEKFLNFWTLSPSRFSGENPYSFIVDYNGTINELALLGLKEFRPSIQLKEEIEIIKGDGTKKNAYQIS